MALKGELVKAIEAADRDKVTEILRADGGQIKAVNEMGRTPLHLAALGGKIEVVRAVMAFGPVIDATDRMGRTPLMLACISGSDEVVRTLVVAGADVNARDVGQTTPLMIGALAVKPAVVTTLLSNNKTERAATTPDKRNALFFAATAKLPDWIPLSQTYAALMPRGENGRASQGPDWDVIAASMAALKPEMKEPDETEKADRAAIGRALVDAGLDVNAVAEDGTTALHYAVMSRSMDLVSMLLARGAKDVKDKAGHTCVYNASALGTTETVKLLLERGGDASAANGAGWTPVMAASILGNLETVKLLVSKGADVKATNKVKQSALHVAGYRGDLPMANYLLEKGLEADALSETGETPLSLACQGGSVEMVKLLQSKGASVKTAKGDRAPLVVAVSARKGEMVAYLLGQGVDVEQRSKQGLTPLLISVITGDEAIFDQLKRAGANTATVATDGRGAVHLAALLNNAAMMNKLVSAGLNVDAPMPTNGFTALHLTAGNGGMQVMEVLLSHGVNVNAAGGGGVTPLQLAVQNKQMEAIRRLVKAGANPNQRDDNGKSPMSMAVSDGQWGVVAALQGK